MYWDNDIRLWCVCLLGDGDWDTHLRSEEELEGN